MTTAQEFLESSSGESYPTVKFDKLDDAVKGVIMTEPKPFMGTNKFTKQPEQQLPINLQCEEGPQTLWLAESKRALVKSVNKAVKESGAPGLQVGGTLTVQFIQEVPTDLGNPAKLYRAKYVAPVSNGVNVSDVFDDEVI